MGCCPVSASKLSVAHVHCLLTRLACLPDLASGTQLDRLHMALPPDYRLLDLLLSFQEVADTHRSSKQVPDMIFYPLYCPCHSMQQGPSRSTMSRRRCTCRPCSAFWMP
jgi:hypothetical protein